MPRSSIVRKKEMIRTYSVHDFRNHFTNVYNFVNQKLMKSLDKSEIREIVVKGKVKSGKRRIVQLAALCDDKPNPTNVHIFVSSFYRASTADKQQILENQSYLGKENVIFTVRKNWREQLRKQILKYLAMPQITRIVIHHDELDHASGIENLFADIHREFYTNMKIKWVRYSASPEECILAEGFKSKVERGEACILKYDPGVNYVGARYFCENNLVRQATPFILVDRDAQSISLSEQGKEIIERLKQNLCQAAWTIGQEPNGNPIHYRGNVGVIRLTGANDKEQENKTVFRLFNDKKNTIPELTGCAIYMDHSSLGRAKDNIAWDDPHYWLTKIPHDRPVLIFIEYACSRSTEWACHPWLGAYHTYRGKDTPYNTIMQSQERGNGFFPYITTENGNRHEWFSEKPRFLLYGDKEAFELSAELIHYSQYNAPLSSRMVNTKAEWGIPIRGKFNQTVLDLLNVHQRIRSDEVKQRIKTAIVENLQMEIINCSNAQNKTVLEAQKKIIEERNLASGIRRAGISSENLSCYRTDKMKKAFENGEPYGQGERNTTQFNLDISMQDFTRHSQVNNTWPSVNLEKGEYFVTYFLSENEQAILHSSSTGSIYSLTEEN